MHFQNVFSTLLHGLCSLPAGWASRCKKGMKPRFSGLAFWGETWNQGFPNTLKESLRRTRTDEARPRTRHRANTRHRPNMQQCKCAGHTCPRQPLHDKRPYHKKVHRPSHHRDGGLQAQPWWVEGAALPGSSTSLFHSLTACPHIYHAGVNQTHTLRAAWRAGRHRRGALTAGWALSRLTFELSTASLTLTLTLNPMGC